MKITTRVKTRKKIKQRLILTHKPCEEIFPPFEELDKQFRGVFTPQRNAGAYQTEICKSVL